jgi:hypothetical protein
MGTNYFLDQGEGEEYFNYPHVGKISYLSQSGLTFIFYKSKSQQLSMLQSLSLDENIVDEYGNRQDIQTFINKIINLPYKEQDFEFI